MTTEEIFWQCPNCKFIVPDLEYGLIKCNPECRCKAGVYWSDFNSVKRIKKPLDTKCTCGDMPGINYCKKCQGFFGGFRG